MRFIHPRRSSQVNLEVVTKLDVVFLCEKCAEYNYEATVSAARQRSSAFTICSSVNLFFFIDPPVIIESRI